MNHFRIKAKWGVLLLYVLTVSCQGSSNFSGSSKKDSSASLENTNGTNPTTPIDPTENLEPKSSGPSGSAESVEPSNSHESDSLSTSKQSDSDASNKGSSDPNNDQSTDGKTNSALNKSESFLIDSKSLNKPLDVIFAVDTSGSMDQEMQKVTANINVLMDTFAKSAATLDYHIWVVSLKLPLTPKDPSKVTAVEMKVDSNNALLVLKNYFTNPPANLFGLRDQSNKAIVIVTDDNAKTFLGKDFKAYIDSNPKFKAKTSLNGFVWIPGVSKTSRTCTRANDGLEYIALSKDPELKGNIYDLCADNWNPLFTDLGNNLVIKTTTLEYKLTEIANPAVAMTVSIDGVTLNPSSYSFDPTKNTLLLKADVPQLATGKSITILYQKK